MADDNTGAPAPAPADPGASAAPAPGPAPAASPAPAPASVLAGGAAAAASAPTPPPAAAPAPESPHAWLPEKHRVFGVDGTTLDIEASARKVAEAYRHAEQKIGGGDIPPATAEGYKVNVPEALAGKVKAEDLAGSQDVKDLLGKLHGVGASQKVVDIAVGELLQRGIALREAMPVLAASECEATLRGMDGWKSDAEYSRNVGEAFKAGRAIFGKDFDGIVKDYGNDARLISGLASIAREMEEDRGPSQEAQAQLEQNLDQLMASPEYLNAHHPQHASAMAKVSALTARLVGDRPVVTGKSMSFRT
jgi:hypothetical protein